MANTIDVVEFQLGAEHYALDIQIAREIVEMMPITPLPRAPHYLAGIINLRGEITNIINLKNLLGLADSRIAENQKIVVLIPEATGGANVGIIVDDVHSVIQIQDKDVEKMSDGISSNIGSFVKGIIKSGGDDAEKGRSLVIWVDILKVISSVDGHQDT
ncbi:chemotaxis protein CheW [Methanoculleus taiwanensis]|uniref:Chemotaxis protein CheW n=1 Tax=Methanoculleus taiwanensis TaxID=1550565 RepID=A0A498H0N4_9EURY|nr:chemotaxis protein CheW [Methanoculleus taiwanensis]RXE56178.1 chemotaxis protein CheW [Methanoculleus taiwanensis]